MMVSKKDSLAHYGIQGMQWGVRRFQYADGSLTPAGKIRYQKSDVDRDVENRLSGESNVIKRMKATRNALLKMQKDSETDVLKDLSKMKLSDKEKQSIWSKLDADFGKDGTDDPELLEIAVQEYVSEVVGKRLHQINQKHSKQQDKLRDSYARDSEMLYKPLYEKYKDANVAENLFFNFPDAQAYLSKVFNEKLNQYWADQNSSRNPADLMDTYSDSVSEAIVRLSKDFSVTEMLKRHS